MDARDKTLPRGPQETAGPDPSLNPDAIVDNPGMERADRSIDGMDFDTPRSLAFTDDEPAADVGDEVGAKPFLNLKRWQIISAVAGGVAVAAGVAGVLYMRSRQKPQSRVERFAHKVGLNKLDLSKPGLGYARKAHRPNIHMPDMSRFHVPNLPIGRNPAVKARDKALSFFH